MGKFNHKIVAVTGAGQGIGFAVAKKFAEEGATVIAIGRTFRKVQNTADSLKEFDVVPYGMDCSVEAEWKKFVSYVKDNYGMMDVLINNAGIELSKDILTETFEEFQKVENCNVDSVFLGMKYCHEILKKGENASIVNISSVASKKAGPACGNDGSYSASKAAVNMLSKHAAYTFAKDRIRVNSILPGGVRTAMVDDFFANTPNAEEVLAGMNPLPPHIAEPDAIAKAAAFLAGPESNFTTGAELLVDSGMYTI